MAVPKRRTSKMKGRKRRTHYVTSPARVVICGRCGSAVLPHFACKICGTYRGRMVLPLKGSTPA